MYSIHLGELPPPPPRACFGRDGLIGKIVGLAESLAPIALIGAGGIGKTSIALAVLHHSRIKERFGDNRRFIRCDQFPTSCVNFLGRLSKVIGAGVENPQDMVPLRPHLSAKEMLIILDNAESILDPQGTNAREIFAVVEELSQLGNICLCVTSRITTIPPDCKSLDIPPLSMDAARSTFYRIYDDDGGNERPDLINNILERLDFHPLSVTLLATVAHHNKWDSNRLAREWEQRQTGVLQTEHNRSLAATIELSLASPMFRELGPDARDLLGVVAFFPQGIWEGNIDWLFSTGDTPDGPPSTASERKNVFDKFCVLSLTYRNNGFVTMLAPLRDYLCPPNPASSSLLCTVKERYFHRLSARLDPGEPEFKETGWIVLEDVNIEHLLDVFTSIDANSADTWDTCGHFIGHLYWHKPRLVVLGPKIEALPDDHRSKPRCLVELSTLFESVGNQAERKRLLTHALELWRERGSDHWVARVLEDLSDIHRYMGLRRDGIQLAKEALEILERLGDTAEEARCLNSLAWLLHGDGQFDAAEEAASRAINLTPEKGDQYLACGSHRILGNVYQSKGETERAINHFETVLKIASSFDWQDELFQAHHALVRLYFNEGRLDAVPAHIESVKSHANNNPYKLGRAMQLQAMFWYLQDRIEEAKSEALRVADIFEKLGAASDLEACRALLRAIEEATENSGECDPNGERSSS